ncbi:MAG: thiamine phosphate synthase [Raoultibacter sp.]
MDVRGAMALYAVTDRSWLRGRTLPACVADALAGGATCVQLREKHASFEEACTMAHAILPLCRAAGVPLIINDNVEVARAVGADGVHVGQSDVACAAARAALGPRAIVGVSVQTLPQARAACAAGADYLGVGAVFPTSTKSDALAVSPSELAAICAALSIPVVAIGGVSAHTIGQLRGTGIAGAAVVSALFAADDIEAAARELAARIRAIIEP